MKPELWQEGDILEVTKWSVDLPKLVEFQKLDDEHNLLNPSNTKSAIVKTGDKQWNVFLKNLKLVSRPSNPFKIGEKVKITREPEKQAIVIGFAKDLYMKHECCILDRKLNPNINLVDGNSSDNFPEESSLWGCCHLSPVESQSQSQKISGCVFAKFNPLRLLR